MPFKRLHFQSPLTPQQCLARVTEITDLWGSAIGLTPVHGKVGADGFHWCLWGLRLGWVLQAKLLATASGTRINALIRPSIPLILWILSMGSFALGWVLIAFWDQGRLLLTGETFLKAAIPVLITTWVALHLADTWWTQKRKLTELLCATLEIDRPNA